MSGPKTIDFSHWPLGSWQRQHQIIQLRLVEMLRAAGETVKTGVHTTAGIADVVTPTAVYEVKPRLDFYYVRGAIGQVMLYAAALGDGRAPKIAGAPSPALPELRALLAGTGIELVEVVA